MNRLLVYLFFLLSFQLSAQYGGDYFVAVDGNDNNPGNFDQPFKTWQKGFDVLQPGDTLYIRGGVYFSVGSVDLAPGDNHGNSGTAANPILIAGYPPDIEAGNWPVRDCKYHCDSIFFPYGDIYNSSIYLRNVEYISLKCLEIRNVFQCDSVVTGAIAASGCANITYERIKIHDVGQRGFYHTSGAWSYADSTYAVDILGQSPENIPFNQPDTTRWINCDVWNICDTLTDNPGNAGDGWKVISYNGNYHYWEGCRAWNYSDDGFDPNNGTRVFKNCWAMSSNKYAGFGIECNGFKTTSLRTSILPYYTTGDYYNLVNDSMVQTIGCLALFCPGSGFKHGVESDTTDNPLWYNNTTYKCGIGISSHSFGLDSIGDVFHNNLVYSSTMQTACYTPYEVAIMNTNNFNLVYNISHSTWVRSQGYPCFAYNPLYDVTDDDFVTTDSLELVSLFTSTRKLDGSLPDIRPLMLKSTSELTDAGCNIGQPYLGLAPDVGYSEFLLTSYFQLQDTVCVNMSAEVEYTGTATDAAAYHWDFDGATIISGSGQGPYILQWSTVGSKTVSLYVEESGFVSDTTTNDIFISQLTSSFDLQDSSRVNYDVEIQYTGNATDAATYHWDFDGAIIISGTGQGPYILQWSTVGSKTVSLYVEESGFVSDSTTNNILITLLSSSFDVHGVACVNNAVEIQYTGNASDTATYYWDFDGATIINGSGQGPYTVLWSNGGFNTVSLYLEESNFVSDTTYHGVSVVENPNLEIVSFPGDTVSTIDTINLTGDISSGSYLWSTGDTIPSINVFNTSGANGGNQIYWLRVTNQIGCSSTDTIVVRFEVPVLINDLQNEIGIKVYPNPVQDILNIELAIAEQGRYFIEVVDNVGHPVIREMRNLESGTPLIQFSMDHTSPGFYIISVKSEGGLLEVMKIIKI